MDKPVNEMVIRVAYAIWQGLQSAPPMLSQESVLAAARGAIIAMREPTEAMTTAGKHVYPNEYGGLYQRTTGEQWKAMIDEALK